MIDKEEKVKDTLKSIKMAKIGTKEKDYGIMRLAFLISRMNPQELKNLCGQFDGEDLVLMAMASKQLKPNNPNRKYVISYALDKNLVKRLENDAKLKRLLDKHDLKSAEIREMLLDDEMYGITEDYIVSGEETFRKSRKKIQAKSRKREQKIVTGLNSIGKTANTSSKKIVNNINNLKYK